MIGALLAELMAIPGVSGQEGRVAHAIARHLDGMGICHQSDRLGNLGCTLPGDPALPAVLIFAHMDQPGFIVRKIEADGLIRLERLGGIPERALAAQAVVIGTPAGDIPAVIGHKSHHATPPDEKYRVVPYADLYVDAGFSSRDHALAAGIRIGAPVAYMPRVVPLAGGRIAGTAIDDRAGCAVLLALAARRKGREGREGPPLHLVWSVQEEYNLRGVLPMARAMNPAIALQIDLLLACDTPDMATRGEVRLGAGPGMSMYSFHGRGTLNGVIPHPALVTLMEKAAMDTGLPLQRSAHTGALTDLSYLQFEGDLGIACLDVGFPLRYTHSALEVVDLADLKGLARLLDAALDRITPDLPLIRTP